MSVITFKNRSDITHLHSPLIAGVDLEVVPVRGVQPQQAATS
jgi:hypothetical protein